MERCPKCGSYRVSGPLFSTGTYGEFLEYRCQVCTYSERKLPLDTKDDYSNALNEFRAHTSNKKEPTK
jgi:hypothetical protein